ncbi:hypothetical protein Q7C36_000271 [Tachysurus vachellii]|uniref:Uncharacterized protein n=1 Tax=Tachysurus vachellii TaxID=175792 RepID=A0AA88TC49_TACVA|nr:hypothetical protein Q7C36_000271 [Tachysurus vachellii]
MTTEYKPEVFVLTGSDQQANGKRDSRDDEEWEGGTSLLDLFKRGNWTAELAEQIHSLSLYTTLSFIAISNTEE